MTNNDIKATIIATLATLEISAEGLTFGQHDDAREARFVVFYEGTDAARAFTYDAGDYDSCEAMRAALGEHCNVYTEQVWSKAPVYDI